MTDLNSIFGYQSINNMSPNYASGSQAQAQALDLYNYYASLQSQNAANMSPGPVSPAPRFRNIDPTQKLSDQAARLLSANHWLVQS